MHGRTQEVRTGGGDSGGRRTEWAALVAAVVLWGVMPPGALAERRDLFGWVERVFVGEQQISLKAKLDTGAETSSLDATGIRRLRRKSTGQRFIEFEVADPANDRALVLKKELVRDVRIKQHDGSFQTRPVVELSVCLGDTVREIEVSLIDRSEFLYPLLLGRSALAGIAVVDPERTFTREPDCEIAEASG